MSTLLYSGSMSAAPYTPPSHHALGPLSSLLSLPQPLTRRRRRRRRLRFNHVCQLQAALEHQRASVRVLSTLRIRAALHHPLRPHLFSQPLCARAALYRALFLAGARLLLFSFCCLFVQPISSHHGYVTADKRHEGPPQRQAAAGGQPCLVRTELTF